MSDAAVHAPTLPRDSMGMQNRPPVAASYLRRLRPPPRTSLWMGLLLVSTAAIAPATMVAQPGSVALLKVGSVALLTLLPGWLYVVYLDRRGGTLYDEFVLNLFRLRIDALENLPMPPQHTSHFRPWQTRHAMLSTHSHDNLYRRRFESIYGRQSVTTRSAWDPEAAPSPVETFSPVLLATVFIGLGWVLTLQPELLVNTRLLSGVEPNGMPLVPVQALQFAFVGAYAFILQDLMRRYFVVDLRNTAYVAAISRIILVALVVTVLYSHDGVLGPGDLASAFVIGFFPRAALEALQARTVRPLARMLQGSRNERLLGELDGMDIWQETRLAELGIENLQQFVTTDLVEVLLRSRTPVARLVEWLDRALLLLLLPAARQERDEVLRRLRSVGVRYATDLAVAVGQAATSAGRAEVAAALGLTERGLAVALESLRHQQAYQHVVAFQQGGWLCNAEA